MNGPGRRMLGHHLVAVSCIARANAATQTISAY